MMPEGFFGSGNDITLSSLPPEHEASIEAWSEAIEGGRVGFLPRLTSRGLFWYAFAPTTRERRELLDLLDAWVGPTFTDLPRSRGRLYPADPFDAPLATSEVVPLRFEVLPRGNANSRNEVRKALLVMSRLIWRRPLSEFDAPRTTVEVLDDLGHAISANDQRLARLCLRELETTADLDQSNLTFLRLRVLGALEDWDGVLDDRDLEHVLQLRRPLGITRVLQRAVYERFLIHADLSGSAEALKEAAEIIPLHFRALTTGAVTVTRAGVIVEFLLYHFANAPSQTLDRLRSEAAAIAPGLGDKLSRLSPSAKPGPNQATEKPEQLGVMRGIEALIDAGEYASALETGLADERNLADAALLLACLRELDDSSQAARVAKYIDEGGFRASLLQGDAVVRSDLEWLDTLLLPDRSLGWHKWFGAIAVGDAEAIAEVDLTSASDWDVLDSGTVSMLMASLDDEALSRFGEHGGPFMANHRAVFTHPSGGELCERVLAALALSEKHSAGVRVQTLALLDYLAASEPPTAVLVSALEWVGLILESAVSAISASWAVDILQAATSSPPIVARDAKLNLFFRAFELLRPIRSGLSLTDFEGLNLVADELGASLPDDFESGETDEDPAVPFRHLEGKFVVLYSLTESATTRVAQILRRLIPGIDVRTTSEHDGSTRLGALSANADVFVVVTASAKHAATDFIKEHRGGLPIIQVNSRGSSAILRELASG
jgi:hypothetical protein